MYVSIVSIFHGVTHLQLVSKLLAFHNLIIDLAKTYDWQKAVLVLALLHHRTALQKGFANLIVWEVPANLIDRHCRAHPKSTNLPTLSSTSQPGKLTYKTNPTNKPGVICRNYNEKGCTSERCNWDHICLKCKGIVNKDTILYEFLKTHLCCPAPPCPNTTIQFKIVDTLQPPLEDSPSPLHPPA
jgi:hypothetical protein